MPINNYEMLKEKAEIFVIPWPNKKRRSWFVPVPVVWLEVLWKYIKKSKKWFRKKDCWFR